MLFKFFKIPDRFSKFQQLPIVVQKHIITFLEDDEFKNGHLKLSYTNKKYHYLFLTRTIDLQNNSLVLTKKILNYIQQADEERYARLTCHLTVTLSSFLSFLIISNSRHKQSKAFQLVAFLAVILIALTPITARVFGNRDDEKINNQTRGNELFDSRDGTVTDVQLSRIKKFAPSLYRTINHFFETRGKVIKENHWVKNIAYKLSRLN